MTLPWSPRHWQCGGLTLQKLQQKQAPLSGVRVWRKQAINIFFMTLRHRAHRIYCSHKWPLIPGCLLKTVNNQIKDIPHPRFSFFISLLLTDYNEYGHRNPHKSQIKCFCCFVFFQCGQSGWEFVYLLTVTVCPYLVQVNVNIDLRWSWVFTSVF